MGRKAVKVVLVRPLCSCVTCHFVSSHLQYIVGCVVPALLARCSMGGHVIKVVHDKRCGHKGRGAKSLAGSALSTRKGFGCEMVGKVLEGKKQPIENVPTSLSKKNAYYYFFLLENASAIPHPSHTPYPAPSHTTRHYTTPHHTTPHHTTPHHTTPHHTTPHHTTPHHW